MFKPVGEKSRRAMVIELVKSIDYGEIITYETLMAALDVEERQIAQAAVHSANPGIERAYSKALQVVANVGYRVVEPAEQKALAQRQQRKASRSIVRAKSKVDHVDLSKLTDAERGMFSIAVTMLAGQLEFARRADLRYARKETVERFMSEQSSVNARTDDELREMHARLAQLESHLSASSSPVIRPGGEAAPLGASRTDASASRGASQISGAHAGERPPR